VLRRTGRKADGWFPYYPFFSEDALRRDLDVVRTCAVEAGRDPDGIGLEGAIYFHDERFALPPGGRLPPETIDECVEYAQLWKQLGATRYWVTAPWADLGPEETGVRDPDKQWSGVDGRIEALRDFAEAVGPGF
jgi:alkanesulfonate monooxygenase SsuD/methylene tetrahydromethanopterin reductase-like flavin-dependent oxidoreductase (luciferase family)